MVASQGLVQVALLVKILSVMPKLVKFIFSFLVVTNVMAYSHTTIGDIGDNIVSNFNAFGKLIVAFAYVSGIGFGIAAVFKFKQHKDNVTQIPISAPFSLLAVSIILVFVPSLYKPVASTVFGRDNHASTGFDGQGATQLSSSPMSYVRKRHY